MDQFQKEYTRIMSMDRIEMQEEVKRLSDDCACPSCPSYRECDERLFCILGESECIKDEKGCLCPTCLVASTLGSQETFTVLEALRWIRDPNHNLSKSERFNNLDKYDYSS